MKVTVTTPTDSIFTLEVNDDMELENFKALLEFESGVATNQMALFWNGAPLADGKKSLKDYGINDGDVLLLHTGDNGRENPRPAAGQASGGK